jgi:hypothetical protein
MIYESAKFWCGEFTPAGAKRLMPAAEKVIYYICSWHYHELPNPTEFMAAGISCEIVDLTPATFNTDRFIKELRATHADTKVPTLLIVQRILPFQLAAWGIPSTHEQ